MTKKRGCLMFFVAGVVVLLCIVVATVGYSLLSPPTTRPIVMINAPRNAARLSVDQDTVIQAVARDDQRSASNCG